MLKILQFILLFPALCLFYLLVWPVEIDPVAWDAPIPPAMEGNFAKNNFLKDIEILGLNDGIGPEDVAIDDSGNVAGAGPFQESTYGAGGIIYDSVAYFDNCFI